MQFAITLQTKSLLAAETPVKIIEKLFIVWAQHVNVTFKGSAERLVGNHYIDHGRVINIVTKIKLRCRLPR